MTAEINHQPMEHGAAWTAYAGKGDPCSMAHPPTAPTPAHPAGPDAALDEALRDAEARNPSDSPVEPRSFQPRPVRPPSGLN